MDGPKKKRAAVKEEAPEPAASPAQAALPASIFVDGAGLPQPSPDCAGKEQKGEQPARPIAVDPQSGQGDGKEIEGAAEVSDKSGENAKKKASVFIKALAVIFFPITAVVKLFTFFTRKIKLSVTTKTTIIFTVLFGLLITAYVIFIITSIESQLSAVEMEGKQRYLNTLKIASVILVIVFVALGAAIGNIASQYMMTPLRRMIKQIDEVNGDNLAVRLDPVDSQDELTELTERINDMLTELEDTFERQSNFISDASHELKTPISVIQGYANMLKRWGKSDPALLDESIDTLLGEAENMKRIVEQLLLLAKIGNYAMTKTRFDMAAEIGETVEKYSVAGLNKRIKFIGGGEIWVETDKNMLIESVRALIDNSVKYTPDGGKINVTCKRNQYGAFIRVSDNGIGIPAEQLPHIFERFYRCDKARSRSQGSSGLGLTITKSIVEMMGGKIEVTSKVGEGSDFTIQLF